MKIRQNWDATTIRRFRRRLLRWYGRNRRVLPWRSNPTPYRVWISEIMLQQTQAQTVVPYYDRFLKRFPDLESLARASEQEILRLWSGLGYYQRARNLRRAARRMVRRHGGFPAQYEAILALPGVGRYTAGAISSIAFNQGQPVVDGNIRRVLDRLHAISRRPGESHYWNRMSALLPERNVSCFNQAMMELGALVCVPVTPRCRRCPAEGLCEARRSGMERDIPRARARQAPRHLRIVTLVLQHGSRVLLASLTRKDCIPGKWGLPYQIVPGRASAQKAASHLCREVLGRVVPLAPCARIRHSISRYRILAWGFCGEADFPGLPAQKTAGYRWAPCSLDKTPLTCSLFRKMLQKHREGRGRAAS